jgi:uncharacterized protein YodC (DUF2158 family)
MAFQLGQTVQLKSGGPRMTVTELSSGPQGRTIVSCIWFDGQKQMHGNFSEEALKDSPDPQPTPVRRRR